MPLLIDGFIVTAKITLTAIVVGILWGTVLAVMRLSHSNQLAVCGLVCEYIPFYSVGYGFTVVLLNRT